jgi:hypothetical protein
VSASHWLTRTLPLTRVVRVEPPARVIRCGTCHSAHAARGDVAAAVRTPRRSNERHRSSLRYAQPADELAQPQSPAPRFRR